jgi:tetratricopeptide (TPR) repeat protein
MRRIGLAPARPTPSASRVRSRRSAAPRNAEGSYHEALALASELGMHPLIAHCHLGLGKLYRRTGQREQAREHLATATTMYREMGMTYWLEQAEAETSEVAR